MIMDPGRELAAVVRSRKEHQRDTNLIIDSVVKEYGRYGIVAGGAAGLFIGAGGALAIISHRKNIPLGPPPSALPQLIVLNNFASR